MPESLTASLRDAHGLLSHRELRPSGGRQDSQSPTKTDDATPERAADLERGASRNSAEAAWDQQPVSAARVMPRGRPRRRTGSAEQPTRIRWWEGLVRGAGGNQQRTGPTDHQVYGSVGETQVLPATTPTLVTSDDVTLVVYRDTGASSTYASRPLAIDVVSLSRNNAHQALSLPKVHLTRGVGFPICEVAFGRGPSTSSACRHPELPDLGNGVLSRRILEDRSPFGDRLGNNQTDDTPTCVTYGNASTHASGSEGENAKGDGDGRPWLSYRTREVCP